MSKASKTKRSIQRRKEKRARKEAQRARYRAWSDLGDNQKTKRHTKKSRTVSRRKGLGHVRCGNTGCGRCFPQYAKRHLA